jgi:ATP-binding protein involved in chromosome partitioning
LALADSVDLAAVRAAVARVEDPELRRPMGDLDMVRTVEAGADDTVRIVIAAPLPNSTRQSTRSDEIQAAAESVPGVAGAAVEFVEMTDEERAAIAPRVSPGPGITVGAPGSQTRIITIASGKGGVGKSSVTTNLAVALAAAGHSVGVIDADVWGFSIPKMLGIDRNPIVFEQLLLPPEAYGVRAISMDYFVGEDQAVVWRGPMLHKALEQFLGDVFWDDPDFLLLDMPPGTGDVSISISQFLPRAQSILVTTPQITAQRVAKRAALMAEKVNQEVLGVIENMSWFTGEDGVRYPIFGQGGGAALATELGVPFLGQIPLLTPMRESADAGVPVLVTDPDGEASVAFRAIAEEVVARRPKVRTHPELVIR